MKHGQGSPERSYNLLHSNLLNQLSIEGFPTKIWSSF